MTLVMFRYLYSELPRETVKDVAMGKKALHVLACFIDLSGFTAQTANDNGSGSSPQKRRCSAGDVIDYGPWM